MKRDLLDNIFLVICLALFIVNVLWKRYDHAQIFLSLMILLTLGNIRSDLREKADR